MSVDCTFSHDFRNVCYPGLLLLLFFFFLIIKKWKSERPNLGCGGSKIGISRQNRDTWQIWGRIPVIIISILGNIVLSDFYIGLAQFRRPYVPIFRSFSYKNPGFKSKKNKNEANTKSGNPRSETRRIFMPEWHILRPLPLFNIGLCLHVLRNIKRLLLRRSPDLSFSPDFF